MRSSWETAPGHSHTRSAACEAAPTPPDRAPRTPRTARVDSRARRGEIGGYRTCAQRAVEVVALADFPGPVQLTVPGGVQLQEQPGEFHQPPCEQLHEQELVDDALQLSTGPVA